MVRAAMAVDYSDYRGEEGQANHRSAIGGLHRSRQKPTETEGKGVAPQTRATTGAAIREIQQTNDSKENRQR